MTYRRIREVDYSFPDEPHVSDDAKNFIQIILVKSPYDRPTLDSLLWHPFINGKVEIPQMLSPKCLYTDEPEYIEQLMQKKNPHFGMSYQDHLALLKQGSYPKS